MGNRPASINSAFYRIMATDEYFSRVISWFSLNTGPPDFLPVTGYFTSDEAIGVVMGLWIVASNQQEAKAIVSEIELVYFLNGIPLEDFTNVRKTPPVFGWQIDENLNAYAWRTGGAFKSGELYDLLGPGPHIYRYEYSEPGYFEWYEAEFYLV
jgi:hypothetical protein